MTDKATAEVVNHPGSKEKELCFLKVGDDEAHRMSVKIGTAVAAAFQIKGEIERLQMCLEGFEAQLAEVAAQYLPEGLGEAVYDLPNLGITVVVALDTKVEISNPEELERALEIWFDELVETARSYRPTRKLIDMAMDGDSPLGKMARPHLTIEKAEPRVEYSREGER